MFGKFKKSLCLILSVIFAVTMAFPACAADTEKNYIIDNPYDDVDWDAWDDYKTQLHCHTNASDGFLPVEQFCDMHYALNYEIVALTDHGTLNRGWNVVPDIVPLMRIIKKERTNNNTPIIPISEEAYQGYLNGTNPDRTYTSTAGDTLTRTTTNGMLDVPLGNEQNMATPFADCHLTSYWAEYGNGYAGVFGDYETPCREVAKLGGITFLSHVGEYVYPKKDTADHVGQKIDEYYVNKFARIFLDNPGNSLGMGINSATDAHTRCDRILYDQILQKTIPNGVVPWGNTFADSHNETSLNDAYTMSWMPELTLDAFRKCLEKGQFFSVSHFSNGVELNGMEEMPGFVEQDVYDTRAYWLDNTPQVKRITVDQENDTITVEGINANIITWVSDCNVIMRTELVDGKATLDLHSEDLLADPNLYVRFYLSGDNGICYANPMVLNVEGEKFEPVNVPKTHDISTFLRGLVTVLDVLVFKFNPIIWIFKYFALGYNPLTQLFKLY
ncbi:MAG: hypothetical protein IJB86_08140 [Clostridia bacterium]|nr:hypothetical protein [Clostridia bacterium]